MNQEKYLVESILLIKKFFFNVNKSNLRIEEHFFESTKLSLIKRNFFLDRILEKCFYDSKKLSSQCGSTKHFVVHDNKIL